jgi:tRNA uridine 5-carbamoylmethylation protein Kti12
MNLCVCVGVHCQQELALQRNRQRQGAARIPDSVLVRCAAAFEPPDPQRRPWEVAGRTWTLQAGTIPFPLEGVASSRCGHHT